MTLELDPTIKRLGDLLSATGYRVRHLGRSRANAARPEKMWLCHLATDQAVFSIPSQEGTWAKEDAPEIRGWGGTCAAAVDDAIAQLFAWYLKNRSHEGI